MYGVDPNMVYEVDAYDLISLIEERPAIWDRGLEDHKIKYVTDSAWQEISVCLNKDFEGWSKEQKKKYVNFIIKKWKNIKDCWIKWNRKKQTGKNSKHLKRYVYDEQLKFLRKRKKSYPDPESTTSLDNQTSPSEADEKPSTSSAADISPLEKSLKRKTDDIHKTPMMTLQEIDDRHLYFFKGVLPSLRRFNETQVLKFQIGLLQLVTDITKNIPKASTNDPLNETTQYVIKNEADYPCYDSYHKNLKLDSSAVSHDHIKQEGSPCSSLSDDVLLIE